MSGRLCCTLFRLWVASHSGSHVYLKSDTLLNHTKPQKELQAHTLSLLVNYNSSIIRQTPSDDTLRLNYQI
ncbi:hypothetical protein BDZ94DRAFT_1258956 [Collybia nuda]|uniref:Uncharacterized protein n=1 Tax=Collybia nuda TaxID=64659 RepID=A0A9P5Y7C6_9AGAR|nr:hypothetical protein BDZ94DRAFT_1258956 [Collybia nuda]